MTLSTARVCEFCRTEMQMEDDDEYVYLTCECPGNVIVVVK